MNRAGHEITTLLMCGGLSKNPLFVQQHADVTGFAVVLPREQEVMVVGSAILAAKASGHVKTLWVFFPPVFCGRVILALTLACLV